MGTSLMPYASNVNQSKGRLFPEAERRQASAYQRDRDRIIHSTAFRRLEYKTQVFVNSVGDHYRTRLTHSLEVSQIARSLSRVLGLDEDLAESIALAHDLGHTPFGHAGESALDGKMAPYGGFCHNDQALRIVTQLENRYFDFEGLNLTWECLEGIVKHNGPLTDLSTLYTIPAYDKRMPLDLTTFASLEAQVAAIADDIAYSSHDLDDGLRAGLFEIEDLYRLPFVGDIFKEIATKHPGGDRGKIANESLRRTMSVMIQDVTHETLRGIDEFGIKSVADVRAAPRQVVGFSKVLLPHVKELRTFMSDRILRHHTVVTMADRAKKIVSDLFDAYRDTPQTLPSEWVQVYMSVKADEKVRVIADYIAGMTDRYAEQAHERLMENKRVA